MSEIEFTNNFHDLCVASGVNAGFQFEFYCQRCHTSWRSEFVAYTGGQAAGWLGKASGLLGGLANQVGTAMEGLAQSGYGKAKDQALLAAAEKAKGHFHRCPKCVGYFCGKCWNTARGLCLNCAPSAEVAMEAAKAEGMASGAAEVGQLAGAAEGKKLDLKKERQLVCPSCGVETEGAKFCPGCGKPMNVKVKCPKCSMESVPGTKFCPGCGQNLSAPSKCPKCSKDVQPGAAFCPDCGQKL